MAGLTSQGLTIKRLEEVVNSLKSKAVSLFQDLVPVGDVVDTSDGTALGRIIGVSSPDYSDLWEAIQQVYLAFDPNSATGIAQDNLVQLIGLTRFEATASTCFLELKGDYLTSIPSGNIASSSITGSRFITDTSIILNNVGAISVGVKLSSVTNSTLYRITTVDGGTSRIFSYTSDSSANSSEILNGLKSQIDSLGSTLFTCSIDVDQLVITCLNKFSNFTWTLTGPLQYTKISKLVNSECEEEGPIEQPAGTINTIATPILGWDSVSNPISAQVGRLKETDEELRLRDKNSKYVLASNLTDALYSDLRSLSGVEKVYIVENKTDTTDSNGLSAHSYMPIVQGGLDSEIGQTIWNNRPTGIESEGDVSVSVVDVQGQPQTVLFKRPTPIRIYIKMDLTKFDDYPVDGDSLVKKALVDYGLANFFIGNDVIYSRLFTPINSVPGHQVDSLYIGISSSPTGEVNIPIDFDEKANLELGDIEII